MKAVFSFQYSVFSKGRGLLWLLLALCALGVAGCVTPESENMSERPWTAPQSWESGLPSGLTEGR